MEAHGVVTIRSRLLKQQAQEFGMAAQNPNE